MVLCLALVTSLLPDAELVLDPVRVGPGPNMKPVPGLTVGPNEKGPTLLM